MEIAYTILRAALGLNIFMHGFVRLHNGTRLFEIALEKEFHESFLSATVIRCVARMLPPLETVIGVLLLTGLFTQPAIISGSLLMFFLIIGKSIKAEWQTVSLQMIYIAFYAVLAAYGYFNTISLDNLFFNL